MISNISCIWQGACRSSDVRDLPSYHYFSHALMFVFWIALALLSGIASAEDKGEQGVPANPCYSTDPTLGDSAYWASTAVRLFSEQKYEDAIATVDACFQYWGPAAGQQQKKMYDQELKCPPTGKVKAKIRAEIEKDYLINDVSMALWAKARSLHELKKIELAVHSYAQCLYMSCGRSWDTKGWFWSPAQDCAVYARKLARK